MPKPRNYYRYDYRVGGKIRHSGITKKPDQREQQHQTRWPGGHLSVVGPAVTEETAREWEKTKRKSITPPHKPPKK